MGAKLDELGNTARFPPPSRLNPDWFTKLPGRLEEQERAVAAWAWFVHRWRRGDFLPFPLMRRLSRLEALARKSFDYWLNSWDLLDPPQTEDKP